MSKAAKLLEQGYKALKEGRADKALEISRQIKELRHTSTFEIGARAYWMLGKEKVAIDVLHEGLSVAPGLHVLWEYLGCYHSDLNQFEEAQKAFESGMACEGAPRNAYLYNFAVLRERQERLEDALKFVDDMVLEESLSPSRALIEALRGRLLHAKGKLYEAQELVRRWAGELKARENDLDEEETQAWSQLLVVQARVERTWALPVENIKGHCRNAIILDGENSMATLLLREIQDQRSERSRHYRLLVHGELTDEVPPRAFYRNFDVIADDPEEGLDFARIAEPDDIARTLKIEESTDHGARPHELKGLISADRERYVYVPDESGSE